jgi:hypothetical protein
MPTQWHVAETIPGLRRTTYILDVIGKRDAPVSVRQTHAARASPVEFCCLTCHKNDCPHTRFVRAVVSNEDPAPAPPLSDRDAPPDAYSEPAT